MIYGTKGLAEYLGIPEERASVAGLMRLLDIPQSESDLPPNRGTTMYTLTEKQALRVKVLLEDMKDVFK